MKKFELKVYGLKHAIVSILIALLMASCASKPQMTKIAEGGTFKLYYGEQGLIKDHVDGAEMITSGIGGGAAGGAALGFGTGLQCGPFFIICSPVAAVIGGVAGSVAGGIHGGMIALPEKEKKQFDQLLQSWLNTQNLAESLTQSFTDRARQNWTIGESSHRLKIKLESFGFVQYSGNKLQLKVVASLTQMFADGQQYQLSKQYNYRSSSEIQPVEFWLKNGGINFETETRLAIANITELMFASLKSPPGSTSIWRAATDNLQVPAK